MNIRKRGDGIYYGWYIVVALAFTEIISWGILYYAFSVFITPLETELLWTRSQITGAFSLSLLVSASMAYPVGWWLDRYGSRFLMTVGSFLAGLLMMAFAGIQTLTEFYVIWGLIGMCLATTLYDPAFVVITNWFTRRRGIGLAIITFSGGLASTVFLPLVDWLIRTQNWRSAALIIGFAYLLLVTPVHALVLRRKPQDFGWSPDGDAPLGEGQEPLPVTGLSLGEAMRLPAFWSLTAAFTLTLLASNTYRVHQIPFMIGEGYDPAFAAWIGSLIGAIQVAGRLVYVPLESRLPVRYITMVLIAIQFIGVALLFFTENVIILWISVIFFGTGYGATTLARPTLLAEQVGVRQYGRINSIFAIFLALAITIAPIGGGILFEWFGSYNPVWIIALFIYLLAAGSLMLVRSPQKNSDVHHPKASQSA